MKAELHMHTCEVSPCGKVPAEEMARLYAAAGYSLLVITDHLWNDWHAEKPLAERAEDYLTGYRIAKRTGEALGMRVLLGMEIRLKKIGNEDFLLYGPHEEDVPAVMTALDTSETFAELTGKLHARGWYIAQAHPFRDGLVAQDTSLLDGVEVYNAHPRHDSHNDRALAMALAGGVTLQSGSDAHQRVDVARGGLNLPEEIDTIEALIAFLRRPEMHRLEEYKKIAIEVA